MSQVIRGAILVTGRFECPGGGLDQHEPDNVVSARVGSNDASKRPLCG